MSTATDRSVASVDLEGSVGPGTFRLLALAGVVVLSISYLSVLREVTSVVGGTQSLAMVVAGVTVAATILAYTTRPRTAAVAAAVVVVLGVDTYLEAAGVGVGDVWRSFDTIVSDAITFASGLPIIRMVEAGTWAVAFAPGPVFLSWYFALRGRYVASVVPGAFALGFLVLTGDAGTTVTLLGTLGALAAVGFGELDRRGGRLAHADGLAILFAVMVVLSLSVAFVGGDEYFGETDPGTLETTLDSAPERSTVGGSVDLSPEVRFSIESQEPSYWRTGVYDRFTGDEWIRSGGYSAYDGAIDPPPGDTSELVHTVTMESDQQIMPTAPQPVSLQGTGVDIAEVSDHGQVHPSAPLLDGDSYTVESQVLDPDPETLRAAGTDYPDGVEETYLQTPEGTSSAFDSYTDSVVGDAETPYETAVAIEAYLRGSKEYSLDVDRPSGNAAEAFLFEMDEGYCVYFATTMTQMLRSQDVPARYVVGYTSGQYVGDDEWVVRGLDAHAWVEVYFPGQGWVAFEPTSGDRDDAHEDALEDARDEDAPGVDTDRSEDVPVEGATDETDTGADDETDPGADDETDTGADDDVEPDDTDPNETDEVNESAPSFDDFEPPERTDDTTALPDVPPEQVAIAVVMGVGLLAGVRRSGVVDRVSREAALYWHGATGTPERDARRAYRRLEVLLADRYRPRRATETVGEYVDALAAGTDLDPRVVTVARRYEQAHYGGALDRAAADEAVRSVDELARERAPFGWWDRSKS